MGGAKKYNDLLELHGGIKGKTGREIRPKLGGTRGFGKGRQFVYLEGGRSNNEKKEGVKRVPTGVP